MIKESSNRNGPGARAARGRLNTVYGVALLGLAAVAGCKDSSGPPEDRVTTIEIVSGDQQQATVGTALPLPLVIRAVDAQGKPVGGAAVEWVVATANGTVTPAGTVTCACPVTVPNPARTSATPEPREVASPLGSTVTTAGFVVVHVYDCAGRLIVNPFRSCADTTNCTVAPTVVSCAEGGVSEIEAGAGCTATSASPNAPSSVARIVA